MSANFMAANTSRHSFNSALTGLTPRKRTQKSLVFLGQFHIHCRSGLQQQIGDKDLIVPRVFKRFAQDRQVILDMMQERGLFLGDHGPPFSHPFGQRMHDLMDEIGLARLFEEPQARVPILLGP
jgi:hypothetical protein